MCSAKEMVESWTGVARSGVAEAAEPDMEDALPMWELFKRLFLATRNASSISSDNVTS
jgi:hypothetical protein